MMITWGEPLRIAVSRLFPDGEVDWSRRFPLEEVYSTSVDDLATDQYGTAHMVVPGIVVSVMATGELYPQRQLPYSFERKHIEFTGTFIERADDGKFLLGDPGVAKMSLPSGVVEKRTSDFNAGYFGEGAALLSENEFVRFSYWAEQLDQTTVEIFIAVKRRVPNWSGSGDPYLEDEVVFQEHVFAYPKKWSLAAGPSDYALTYSWNDEEPELTAESERICQTALVWISRDLEYRPEACSVVQDSLFDSQGNYWVLLLERGELEANLRLLRWGKEDELPESVSLSNLGEIAQSFYIAQDNVGALVERKDDGKIVVAAWGEDLSGIELAAVENPE